MTGYAHFHFAEIATRSHRHCALVTTQTAGRIATRSLDGGAQRARKTDRRLNRPRKCYLLSQVSLRQPCIAPGRRNPRHDCPYIRHPPPERTPLASLRFSSEIHNPAILIRPIDSYFFFISLIHHTHTQWSRASFLLPKVQETRASPSPRRTRKIGIPSVAKREFCSCSDNRFGIALIISVYTTSNGAPVPHPYAAQRAGVNGPLLLQDFHLIDLLSHFDRER